MIYFMFTSPSPPSCPVSGQQLCSGTNVGSWNLLHGVLWAGKISPLYLSTSTISLSVPSFCSFLAQ